MWNDMALDMQKIDKNRQNLNNAVPLMNDPMQLENLKKCFLQHYHDMQCFNRYFTFGTQKTQLNMTFQWKDSFDKQKKIVAQSASLDAYSALYNYAIALARVGILMDLTGDGIKVASKNLCQAASIFNNLKSHALKPAEISPDF